MRKKKPIRVVLDRIDLFLLWLDLMVIRIFILCLSVIFSSIVYTMPGKFETYYRSIMKTWLDSFCVKNSYPESMRHCLEYFFSVVKGGDRNLCDMNDSTKDKVQKVYGLIVNGDIKLDDNQGFTVEELRDFDLSVLVKEVENMNVNIFGLFAGESQQKTATSCPNIYLSIILNDESDEDSGQEYDSENDEGINWGSDGKNDWPTYKGTVELSRGLRESDKLNEAYQQLTSVSDTRFNKGLSGSVPTEFDKLH